MQAPMRSSRHRAGSICNDAHRGGVGVPQLTAIMDAVQEAKKANVAGDCRMCGIKYSGDLAKRSRLARILRHDRQLLAGTMKAPAKCFCSRAARIRAIAAWAV